MPAPTNTLLIEGSLEELSDELANYIDNLRKTQNVEGAPIQPEVSSLLKEGKNEDAMKKLVGAASILNAAPEKGMRKYQRGMKVTGLTYGRNYGSIQPLDPHHKTNA